MDQGRCSREEAIRALDEAGGDIVTAIMRMATRNDQTEN